MSSLLRLRVRAQPTALLVELVPEVAFVGRAHILLGRVPGPCPAVTQTSTLDHWGLRWRRGLSRPQKVGLGQPVLGPRSPPVQQVHLCSAPGRDLRGAAVLFRGGAAEPCARSPCPWCLAEPWGHCCWRGTQAEGLSVSSAADVCPRRVQQAPCSCRHSRDTWVRTDQGPALVAGSGGQRGCLSCPID